MEVKKADLGKSPGERAGLGHVWLLRHVAVEGRQGGHHHGLAAAALCSPALWAQYAPPGRFGGTEEVPPSLFSLVGCRQGSKRERQRAGSVCLNEVTNVSRTGGLGGGRRFFIALPTTRGFSLF